MARKHALVVAASLAFAAVVGAVAVTKTIHLGRASAKPVSRSVIARRTRQLDRFEASLMTALNRVPPAIPKLPPVPKMPAAGAPSAPSRATQRVVYVRPAPIVIHKPGAGGEHEAEGLDRGDGGGGGGDD